MNSIDRLIETLKQDKNIIRLKELTSLVEEKYQEEIKAFKEAERKYEEAKQYGPYHPDLDKIKQQFMEAKNRLFMIDEVKELKQLERDIQKQLKDISDEIKKGLL